MKFINILALCISAASAFPMASQPVGKQLESRQMGEDKDRAIKEAAQRQREEEIMNTVGTFRDVLHGGKVQYRRQDGHKQREVQNP